MVITAAVLAATSAVQATQDQPQMAAPQASQPAAQAAPNPPAAGSQQQRMPPEGTGGPMRNFPPPTNLKVLPKDLTGREVRDIMEKWAGSLGVHCDICHVADPNNLGPNGRPRLNFPDDSKPDKQIARLMYTMTQQINTDYISKAMDMDKDDMGTPVTCGTCHRGHEMPEEFVIPKEERHGGPGGEPGKMPGEAIPPAGGSPSGGAPPAPPSN
jgi:hypothetical protein